MTSKTTSTGRRYAASVMGSVWSGLSYPQIIQAARERSTAYGVNASADSCLKQQISISELRKQNALLLDAAEPVLERLTGQFAGLQSESLFILANRDATILSVEGRNDYQQFEEISDVAPGVCWSERIRGTNALGTALAEAQPMLIDCGEHFLERLDNYSCSSVLLNDAHGEVTGVLSLARKGALPTSKDSLLMLTLTASYIDRRLFISSQKQHITLAFHGSPHYLDSPWQGLLSVSLDGHIMAANEAASELLGLPRNQLLGQSCEVFLGGRVPAFKKITKGLSGALKTRRGKLFYKILQMPESQSVPLYPLFKQEPAPNYLTTANPKFEKNLTLAERGFSKDLPILLLGETGTGKEVIARNLHEQSPRAEHPFIAVNCAAIPEGLIESELFGYKEGAFTGARRGGMIGRLQQANGGTLFLDEVGDMPLELQARLLRVLQERQFTPLGGAQEQRLNIGLICATHRDLRTQVTEQKFREDLYYRINGISLQLPALRERNDLTALCHLFLAREGLSKVHFSPELQRLLNQYHWPGNIRQLEMVMRTLAALADPDQKVFNLDDLPDTLLTELQETLHKDNGHCIRSNENELIRQALTAQEGNVSAAARELGISRATLYRKLKQLEIND